MFNDKSICEVFDQARTAAESRDQIKAEQMLLAGYDEIENKLRKNKLQKGKALHLLANNYRDRGRFKNSRDLYNEAGDNLRDGTFGEVRALFDDIYVQALYEDDFELALKSQLNIYALLSRAGQQPVEVRLPNLLRLACISWKLRQYSEAERYLKEYVRLAEEYGQLSKSAWIVLLYAQGFLCFRMNKLQDAETLYKMALYLDEGTRTLGNEQKAEILSQLGVILCKRGKREEARKGCLKSAQIREACDNHADIPSQFRSIAELYCVNGRYEEAASFCSQANDIFENDQRLDDAGTFIAGLFRRHRLLDDAAMLERTRQCRVSS